MKKTFQITLKDYRRITIDAIEKSTRETTIKVKDYFEEGTDCLFLRIEHNELYTMLDLTNVTPYTILYYHESFIFEAAAFNNNEKGDTPFIISTQYKLVMFIPSFINFSVNDLPKYMAMEYKQETSSENWYEHRLFISGYGKFPYIILKTGYAIFMQIPIHFNAYGDFVNYPGTSLDGISSELILEYERDINSKLHDRLIEHCKWVKSKIEADKNREASICLVEGPKTAYYFDGDKVTFSEKIPYGGTLVTQQNKIIAMNVNHYIEDNPITYSMQDQMGLTIEEQVELLATNPYRYYIAPNVWIGRNLSRIKELNGLLRHAEEKEDFELCQRIKEVKNHLISLYS